MPIDFPSHSQIEAPCSQLPGIFPVRKMSIFTSLAKPAASYGECARRLVQHNHQQQN
jgi:hypothetical protein